MTRLYCSGLVLITLASAASAAPTGDSVARAKLYLERSAALYREGRYTETITELNKGYALAPLPAFLYSLGQAERQAGDCDKAIEHYRAFLETEPSPRQRAATEDQMRRCEALVSGTEPSPSRKGWSAGAMRARTEPVAPTPVPPAPTVAVDLSVAAAPPPAPAPARRRRWVWALTGTLIAAAALAGATTAGVLLTRPTELAPGSFGRLDGRR
jgi:tetratricopeptide (TPR) repeat protein